MVNSDLYSPLVLYLFIKANDGSLRLPTLSWKIPVDLEVELERAGLRVRRDLSTGVMAHSPLSKAVSSFRGSGLYSLEISYNSRSQALT